MVALVVALALLALAPAAQASPKGVTNYFGSFGTQGGQFGPIEPLSKENPTGAHGTAFNATGAGGANAGDIYVADRKNNRIQRFSANGTFIDAWGKDVITGGTTGYEICTAAATCKAGATGTLGGEMNGPRAVAIDQSTGNVYVTDTTNIRVQEFSATGTFIRAWGQDVVQSAKPEDKPAAQAKQTLTVDASAGSYTLTFQGKTTGDLAFNASAATVQSTLRGLTSIANNGVAVTGGPGAAGGGTPYVITFTGGLTNSPQPLITTSPGSTPLSGGAATATVVNTTTGSTGFEICTTAANCKVGVAGEAAGAFGGTAGAFTGSLVVAPVGAPNAGNVLVTDPQNNRRVQEFSAGGAFIRAFGFDVVRLGPSNGGAVNEVQKVTVAATGGNFKLFYSAGGTNSVTLPWNATAAQVESGLNSLTTIGGTTGGSVTVTGGPGDATGSTPYTVTFGGALAGVNAAQMIPNNETLTGGSPSSSATVTTITEGVATFEVCNTLSFDVCKAAASDAGAASGQIGAGSSIVVGGQRIAEDAAGNIYLTEPGANFRVQKFTLPGNVVTPQGSFAAADLTGTANSSSPTDIAVDPATGNVYVAKNFVKGTGTPAASVAESRVLEFSSTGTLLSTSIAQVGISEITGLSLNPANGRLSLSAGKGERIFILDSIPSSVAETFEAEMDDPAITDITDTAATLHGIVKPGQGVELSTQYRFEYTDGFTWTEGPLSNVGNGSGAGDPNACPTGNAPSCNVSLTPTLLTGQKYKVRIKAFVPFHPEIPTVISPYINFRTLSAAPSAKTGKAWWSSPADTTPSLLFTGFVNPKSEPTNFYFQYVPEDQFLESGYENAQSIATPPGEPAAASFNTVEVQQPVYELDPTPTYHYRIVAVNPTGTTFGEDRTLAPPNPADRFYELVSSGNSAGLGLAFEGEVLGITDIGNRALFGAQVMDDPAAGTGVLTAQMAERGEDGWAITTMSPDPDHSRGHLVAEYEASADFSKLLFDAVSDEQTLNGQRLYNFVAADGSITAASGLIKPLTNEGGSSPSGFEGGHLKYLESGASADLSRFFFTAEGAPGLPAKITLIPNEPLIEQPKIYQLNTETKQLSYVNRDSAGNPIGGACGARLGGTKPGNGVPIGVGAHAVSLDGSSVYFNARPGVPLGTVCSPTVESEFGKRIFRRVNDTTTTEISASQCSRPALPEPPGPCKTIAGDDTYLGASDEGSVAFFSSPRQLTSSDTDSAEDLYVYDADPPAGQPTLVQASAGEVTAGHPTIGSGSGFIGVVETSSDGSRVYFVASSQLTPTAANGAGNLYVYERDAAHPTGRIHYIGGLSFAGDFALFQPSNKEAHALPKVAFDAEGNANLGDGHFLVFTSSSALVGADTDAVKDLYRYDDVAEQMLCLSCAGNAAKPVKIRPLGETVKSLGNASQKTRIASADVSDVVFATEEALVAADENTKMDAYEWRNGQLILVSRDTASLGISIGDLSVTILAAPTISQDGKDVYFATESRLVPSDLDTDNAPDIYDARIGGGFAAPTPEARICANGDVCRGPTTSAPVIPGNASTTFNGPGNPAPTKPSCRKGKVLKHGRCVKPKQKKHSHHKKSNKTRGSK